jgi:phosphoglycerate-specific signal transduction histidine kinase
MIEDLKKSMNVMNGQIGASLAVNNTKSDQNSNQINSLVLVNMATNRKIDEFIERLNQLETDIRSFEKEINETMVKLGRKSKNR